MAVANEVEVVRMPKRADNNGQSEQGTDPAVLRQRLRMMLLHKLHKLLNYAVAGA